MIKLPSLDVLRGVPATTLLTEPPIYSGFTDLDCGMHMERMLSWKGLTFGAVVEALERLLEEHEISHLMRRGFCDHADIAGHDPGCTIWCQTAISAEAEVIKKARRALVEATNLISRRDYIE